MLKFTLTVWVTIILGAVFSPVYAQELKIDSLVLQHKKTQERVVITNQSLDIIVTTQDHKEYTGEFIYRTPSHLYLSSKSDTVSVSLNEITVIRKMDNPFTGIVSAIVMVAGFSGVTSGAIIAGVGIAAIKVSPILGYGLIAVAIPITYLGIRALIDINRATRKMKINKRWQIV